VVVSPGIIRHVKVRSPDAEIFFMLVFVAS
jgi:hypothetical protein